MLKMAGGDTRGPPRKSHTKSRKGCKTCKRRHIRCDENFPQCQNCTKHSCRCDYMDSSPEAEEHSPKAEELDLLWTTTVQREIADWQRTGLLPGLHAALLSPHSMSRLSRTDLRLLQHVSSIAGQMQARGCTKLSIWIPHIPILLALSDQHEYLMHAILAFSATHLAWITESPATDNLAFHHRGVALKGLQEAIPFFSKDISDAVLGASFLLSLQATDWEGWRSLVEGTSKVVAAMQDWKQQSALKSYMDAVSMVPAFSVLDSGAHKETHRENLITLQYMISAMSSIETTITSSDRAIGHLRQILHFARSIPSYLSIQNEEAQFNVLLPLRSWLLWSPISLIQSAVNPGTMTVIAYQNAIAIVVESLFPRISNASFGCHSILPIEEATRISSHMQAQFSLQTESLLAMSLMDTPNRVAKDFQYRAFSPALTSSSNGIEHNTTYAISPFHSVSPESSGSLQSNSYNDHSSYQNFHY